MAPITTLYLPFIFIFTWSPHRSEHSQPFRISMALHSPCLECSFCSFSAGKYLPFVMYVKNLSLTKSAQCKPSLCASPVALFPGESGPSIGSCHSFQFTHKAWVQGPHFALTCSDSEVLEVRLKVCWWTRRKINLSGVACRFYNQEASRSRVSILVNLGFPPYPSPTQGRY